MTSQDDDPSRLPAAASGSEALTRPVGEGQLTAALMLQAQALEAMRQAHSDLLMRLEQGPERKALAKALEELRTSTDRVREGQEHAARKAARGRRRFALVGALALLVAGGSAVAVVWSGRRLADETARREAAAREQTVALAALTERLDGQQVELRQRADDALAARDMAQQALADVRDRVAALGSDLDDARRDRDSEKARADREREQHLTALGDGARLRDQLIERDRKLDELNHTLADLQQGRIIPPATDPVEAKASPAGLAARVTSALRGSGVRGVSVVECGGVSEGCLTGVLLLHDATDEAPGRAVHAERAELAVEAGVPALKLTSAGELPESVPLPAVDRLAWRQLGLAVPEAALSAARLAAALGALVAPQGWQVAELRGWDGETLRGLRLEQLDASGRVTRVLRAERGAVLAGPELELKDGTLRVGTDERAFYAGVYRLQLPGADLASWLTALQAESR